MSKGKMIEEENRKGYKYFEVAKVLATLAGFLIVASSMFLSNTIGSKAQYIELLKLSTTPHVYIDPFITSRIIDDANFTLGASVISLIAAIFMAFGAVGFAIEGYRKED